MTQFHKETKRVQQDLPYDQLVQLFKEYQDTKLLSTRDKIFNANIKLVFSICQKYNDWDKADIEQFGFIGLINAIEKFNTSKNYKFSTYATKCIVNEINNGLTKISNVIPIPKHLFKQIKAGDIQEITTVNLHDSEIENLTHEHIENGIDRQLFWILLQNYCSEDEIDLLLKRYCNENELTLNYIAKSINHTKQYTNNKLKRIIKRLKENEVFKNKINDSL